MELRCNMVGCRRLECSGASRKLDTRRWTANSRERSRMHCLNAALDKIRLLMPVKPGLHQSGGVIQKLSKIETLRLDINYISAMQTSLAQGEPLDLLTFWQLLARGLSQQTSQIVGVTLRLYTFNKWEVRDHQNLSYPCTDVEHTSGTRFGLCSSVKEFPMCDIELVERQGPGENNDLYNTNIRDPIEFIEKSQYQDFF